LSTVENWGKHPHLVATGGLELHHIGAKIGEQFSAVIQRDARSDLQYAEPGQRHRLWPHREQEWPGRGVARDRAKPCFRTGAGASIAPITGGPPPCGDFIQLRLPHGKRRGHDLIHWSALFLSDVPRACSHRQARGSNHRGRAHPISRSAPHPRRRSAGGLAGCRAAGRRPDRVPRNGRQPVGPPSSLGLRRRADRTD
jgi:hypothetical protein